ncbi:MAG: putative ABC exporter domain-containing protein [Clostridiales bacterium]|nr:putative ABC exporter domain-containing protein [Clostridiales bacterium]
MRLFLYYASHSLLNTLRKVMKTWVAFILIVIIFGAGVGFVTSLFTKNDKAKTEPSGSSVSTVVEDGEGPGEEIDLEDAISEKAAKSKFSAFLNEHGLAKENVVDLAISAVFLLILATNILNAQNSSKIFLPADVPMLFSSPMKPQSVLMFRLLCTLGSSLLVSLFMLFQLPNLTINAGLTMWGAVSCIIVYAMILVFSTLVQVIFYTITSKFKTGTGNIKTFLAVVYGAIALGFAAFTAISKLDVVDGLFSYFASPKTHWVPFWGWLRGISYYACIGDVAMSLVFLGLFIVACAVLVLIIWKLKADFYEDAMFAAEHKAEQIESAKNAARGGVATRDKERKGTIDREGFRYGSGANVFLYKAVFNRFRFAKLKIFSTTMIIYTIIAGVAAWFARDYTAGDPFFIPAAVLGAMAFYRTLGDPIREDTSKDFFILIPESHHKKLLYSLLGCLAVTTIDLILPMAVAAIMLKTNPLTVLVWFAFVLSISFFATVVGTLISLSLPKDQAQTLSMIVQMMFFYFGLTPSAAAVIVGILTGHVVIAVAIGCVINFVIGFLVSLILPAVLGRK